MYTVYVIYNDVADKVYTGQTEDIGRRLKEHNDHTYKGYTSRFVGRWRLIYSESVDSRSKALKRETQLKSGAGRRFINNLISR